nr:unnamed protein product [Spirometra erinaceieuropaei]
MDDERIPKRLFYGDVARGSHQQGGQIRRYKDTLKTSLERLQINPANKKNLTPERPNWRTVNIVAAPPPSILPNHSHHYYRHNDLTHSPHRWDDVRRPVNFNHQHPHLQRCGIG